MNQRRATILLLSLVGTFIVIRSLLWMSPNSDFNVGGYNIHHLFTGLVLITIGGIPVALFPRQSPMMDVATAIFGIGLALALDEWVYLIATDGTNASYLLPVSFRGGVLMVVLAVVYVVALRLPTRRNGSG